MKIFKFQYPNLSIGGLILVLITLIAITSPFIVPYDPNEPNFAIRLTPPNIFEGNFQHILGTDHLGRDILSRILMGSRISLLIGITAVVFQGIIGGLIGVISGYWSGVIDAFLMRLVDIQLSIPFLVLALTISAVMGQGLLNVVIVLGVVGWAKFARMARGATLEVAEETFIEASESIGENKWKIALKHIVPNISSSLLVMATFMMARVILVEAALSFLGFGVPPEIPTWGSMISQGRDYLRTAWWISSIPGIALVFSVLGINLFGNGIRDALDPRYETR